MIYIKFACLVGNDKILSLLLETILKKLNLTSNHWNALFDLELIAELINGYFIK